MQKNININNVNSQNRANITQLTTDESYDFIKIQIPDNGNNNIEIETKIETDKVISELSNLNQRNNRDKCTSGRAIRGIKSVKKTTEQFIKEAKEKHGDKYDYSKVEYKDCENNH